MIKRWVIFKPPERLQAVRGSCAEFEVLQGSRQKFSHLVIECQSNHPPHAPPRLLWRHRRRRHFLPGQLQRCHHWIRHLQICQWRHEQLIGFWIGVVGCTMLYLVFCGGIEVCAEFECWCGPIASDHDVLQVSGQSLKHKNCWRHCLCWFYLLSSKLYLAEWSF